MRIAYNPKTSAALTAAPSNNDITFDLSGMAIYARGVKFDGKAYNVFKKHASGNAGGYDGLVPAPSYNNNSKNRFLKEDGTWDTTNTLTWKDDVRATSTIPKDYLNSFTFIGIKNSSAIGLPTTDTFVNLIGWKGYLDNTGPLACELASGQNRISVRFGAYEEWGNWNTLAYLSDINVMVGATASVAGKAGLVPAPGAGKNTSFLRGDGTWAVPLDTKVTSVDNHYTPEADSTKTLEATASSTTSATWGSTDLVTGVKLLRDAKGHVTGITVNSIQLSSNPNANTWRAIQANGTQIAGTGTDTYALNFVSGTGIAISGTAGSSSSANKITITNSGVRSTTINGNYLRVNTNGTDNDLTIPYAINADKLDGYHLSSILPISAYSYTSGYLVKTDIATESNTMITFRIEGNSYEDDSILTTGHFYNYTDSNQILNASAIHHGYNFGNIIVFCYNNFVYLWFQQQSNYQSFVVYVYGTNVNTNGVNRVTSITNSALPTSGVTRKVTIIPVKRGAYSFSGGVDKFTVTYPSGSATDVSVGTLLVNGTYTGNGGGQRPSYIGSGKVRWNMMNATTTYFDSSPFSGYCDWMMMDTYTGSDVPYVTMIGVLKSATPHAYIASGAKGDSKGTWTIKTLLDSGNWSNYITLPTIPSISITNSGSGNAVTSITASGHTVTVTKGSTFSLSGHAHNNYLQRLQYWANGESHDADDLLTGITFAYKDKHNAPGYGTLVSFSALSMETYTLQLQGDYVTADLYFRNQNGDTPVWNSWAKVLSDLNYTSYTPILNSSSTHATKNSVIYAPTSAGTSGYVLKSNGSGAPSWTSPSNLSVGYAEQAGSATTAGTAHGLSKSFTVFGVSFNGAIDETVNMSTLIDVMGAGYSNITDSTHILTSHINGFNSSGNTTTIYKRTANYLWNYIKGKIDATYSHSKGYIGTTAVSSDSNAGQNITGIGNITPNATKSYSLGSSALRWNSAYINSFNIHGSENSRVIEDLGTTGLLYINTSAANGLAIQHKKSSTYGIVLASDLFRPLSTGQVSLGNPTYRWNNVYANHLNAEGGKFYTDANGAYWTSDIRFKTNITKARNLDIADLLVEFDWKDSGYHSWGYIAQDLLEILPEAVSYSEDTDRYSVNYNVAHSAAIASLTARIKELEEKLKKYGI